MSPTRTTLVPRPGRAALTVQRVALALAVCGLAVLAASTALRAPGSYVAWADGWLYTLIGVAAAAVCAVRGLHGSGGRYAGTPIRESAWLFIALALTCSALGDATHALWVRSAAEPPYPSIADAFYLAFFPAAYVGLVLLVRSTAPRFLASTWFDGAVAGFGSAAIAWVLGFDQLVSLSGERRLVVLMNFSYPTGDLLLLVMSVTALTAVGWRGGRQLWLLVLGLGSIAVADTVFAMQDAAGIYVEGTSLDVLWPLSSVLIAVAAVTPTRYSSGSRGSASWWSAIAMPGLFTLACVVVLTFTGSELGRYLAAATILAAAVRAAMTFREVNALAEARHQARTDDLTGLVNRRGFFSDLGTSLGRSGGVGVLVLDLNRFKEVNDALGHQAGDQLLRLVGGRISGCLHEGQLLARLGGDEFAILCTPRRAAGIAASTASRMVLDSAVAVAHEITEAMLDPFDLDEITVHVGVSIGVAACPATDDPRHPESAAAGLLQHADTAMYDAKTHGGGFRTYDAGSDVDARDRLRTVEDLRAALERDELVLHYQPKVDLLTGNVSGAEALVRWNHPVRGLLHPVDFLPLAEQAGLMQPLTHYVLRAGLQQVARWREGGLTLTIAVNVSASNLLDVDLVDQVAGYLEELDLPASCLQIEITENTMMADPVRATQVIRTLDDLGVSVAIDDYGTGYSSLSYLRDLPVRELKLDRSFVAGQLSDARSGAIVRSTVNLAHALGLTMVAEGVEDAETALDLMALGCDVAQGFHYAWPMGADQLARWLGQGEGDDDGGPDVAGQPVAGQPVTVATAEIEPPVAGAPVGRMASPSPDLARLADRPTG